METIVTPRPRSVRSSWLRTGRWRIALGLLGGLLALAVIGANLGQVNPRSLIDETRSLLDYIALMQELEDLLGRRIDLVIEPDLHPAIRERVLAEALPV